MLPSSDGTRLFLALLLRVTTVGDICHPSVIEMSPPIFKPGTSNGKSPADRASISLVFSIGPNENSSAVDEYDFLCIKRLDAFAALKCLTVGGVGGRGVDGGALITERGLALIEVTERARR